MGRWKEKRKKIACNKPEHKALDRQIAGLRAELENRRHVILSVQTTLANVEREKTDLEGALIKASLLIEVQQKQMETIKMILGFFEPAKSLSVTELKSLRRVANEVRTEATSNAGTPRPNSNC